MTHDYRDAATLDRLHNTEGLSCREIARRFDVDHTTILYWMDKGDVERRTRAEAVRHDKRAEVWFGLQKRGGHGNPRYVIEFREFGYRRHVMYAQLIALLDHPPENVFSSEYHVHHKNRCPLDDRPSNIDVIPKEEHYEEHREDAREWAKMAGGDS